MFSCEEIDQAGISFLVSVEHLFDVYLLDVPDIFSIVVSFIPGFQIYYPKLFFVKSSA